MNWFSHWDEELKDEIVPLDRINKNPDVFKIQTEDEIGALFATNDEYVTYKSHPSISTNEYREAARNLDLVIDNLKDLSMPFDNATECVICKVEAPKRDNLIRCPHCGESYYMEKYSDCTAMYFPPIYKDGVSINPNRNITTTYCACMNCGKEFSYKR